MKIANAKTFGNQMYLTEADLTSMVTGLTSNFIENPSGGMDGMYLKNTGSGVEWANIEAVPTSLEDMDSAAYQMLVAVNEKVSGIESGATSVDSSTVEGWGYTKVTSAQVADWGYTKVTSANVSTIVTDIAYTKGQVDSTVSAINAKLTNVYTYKGSVNDYANLPSEGMNVGDVYNVANSNKANGIKAGDNVAWNGSEWDVLAGDVDLSEYAMISTVSSMIDDAVETKASVSDLAQVAFTGNYGDLSELPDLSEFTSHIDSSAIHVPTNGSSGQVLKMNASGVPVWDVDLTVGGSAVLPNYDPSKAGKILQVKDGGTETEWVDKPIGNMTIDSFVNGNGVVKSATYATSAVYDGSGNNIVNTYQTKIDGSHKISGSYIDGAVASATSAGYATSAGNVNDGKITIQLNGTSKGEFTVNQSSGSTININGVALSTDLSNYVPTSRTINGKNLSANATIYGSDILDSSGGSNLNAIITSHTTSSAIHVPFANTSSNGLVLKVVNGVPAWDTDLTVGGSAVLPNYDPSKAGQILQVKSDGTGTEWVDKPIGDMTIASFVNGNGVVNSATHAASATYDGSGNTITDTYQTKIDASHKISGTYIDGAVASATKATSATYDGSGNVITDTYQTKIDASHKISGTYIDGAVASATSAGNVNNGKIIIQLNGTSKGEFTVNQSSNSTVNINGVALSTDLNSYATSLDFTMDSNSYVISAVLKNGSTNLSSKTIDLPLETMVVDASYDSANKNINLTLKNGTVTSFGIADLVNGLVPDTRTVNGKALSANVVIYGSDILNSSGGTNLNTLINNHVTATVSHVPSTQGHDNGKVLKIANGSATWGDDLTADGSAVLPHYDSTQIGQILQVTSTQAEGIHTTWATAATGNMNTTDYVVEGGTGVVLSASNATTVNGHTVSANVPADAEFTDTIPGSGVLTISGVGSALGTFNANASSNSTITIPQATSTVYGLAKVEKVVSNTDNAVANSVVSGISATMNSHNTSSALHVPSMATASNGQVLTYDSATASAKWVSLPAGNVGDMTIASFVNGNGVVNSATHAASATYDGSGNTIADTYQTKIDSTNTISGAYVNGAVASATKAVSATHDGSGNVITDTYQTKIDGSHQISGTYISGAVSSATKAASAVYDGSGNTITETYQTKIDASHKISGSYISGAVESATSAGNASTVNGFTVGVNVPSTAVFTDTIPGSATITLKANNTNIGSFSVNASENASVDIPAGTNTSYGVVKVETTISNTTNAVANSVVSATSSSLASAINAHAGTANVHVPSTGTTGYYLKKTENGNTWAAVDIPTLTVDSEITSDGVNAVAGSAIYHAVEARAKIEDLSKVAFTGNYTDLINAPSVSGFESHLVSSIIHVPTGGTSGQVLKVNESGVPEWGTDLTADGSAVLPTYGAGDANKVLKVNGTGTGTSWETANVGDMTIASYVNGNGVVKSATHAASAGSLTNAITINGVSLNAGTTKTLAQMNIASATHTHGTGDITSFSEKVSSAASNVASTYVANNVHNATITFTQGGVTKGYFTLNQNTASTIALDIGGIGSEITVDGAITSNGTNAVAGSAIYSAVVSKVDISDLAHVAFTGNYNDLVSAPSVAPVQVSGSTISSMVAGTNVTLTRNGGVVTIAATGGGNVTVDGTVTQNGTNAVAGSAVYSYVSAQLSSIEALLNNI